MPWRKALTKMWEVLDPLVAAKAVGEKASQTLQKKSEAFIDKKEEEFVSRARTEAEQFMIDHILIIEEKVDSKILKIEKKMDDLIEKEVRHKLRILIYTLVTVILMSLVSLGYLYLKNKFGL